ncbi:S-adenosyl-L-methionine-dependent methyltransferase [Pisolithus croceorrhizus]|nr:S-adenosyl-L-methionine-dependent methyltransferase [Pisolithus croceorrhizus]KAI6160066.1 S-adenosyl-L-methionine-dependent methyltransferase [Pisolithus thermaeus]
MSNIHSIALSGFGAGTNELYDRARPSYPAQLLTFIKSIAPKSEPLNVVEIGAGTGLFTRALLSHSDWTSSIARLRAIEPSEGMRKVWSEKVTVENATIEEGTFESTAVPDGWADLIVIAQAFHWCPDHDKACTEFSRILKKDGLVVFIWNLEDRDRAGWVAQLRERIEQHEHGTPQFRLGLWREAFTTTSYLENFEKPQENVWEYHLVTTESLCVDRALSKSYIAVLPPEGKDKVASDLKAILARGDDRVWVDKSQGTFEYPYKTFVVVSRKK